MSNGLDVALMNNPYGELSPAEGDRHLDIAFNDDEWASFFFRGLGATNATPIEGEPWDEFFERRPHEFRESLKEYPLLARIDDFYQDAYFAQNEIHLLEAELIRASKLALNEDAKAFLSGMLTACKAATNANLGISLLSS